MSHVKPTTSSRLMMRASCADSRVPEMATFDWKRPLSTALGPQKGVRSYVSVVVALSTVAVNAVPGPAKAWTRGLEAGWLKNRLNDAPSMSTLSDLLAVMVSV